MKSAKRKNKTKSNKKTTKIMKPNTYKCNQMQIPVHFHSMLVLYELFKNKGTVDEATI